MAPHSHFLRQVSIMEHPKDAKRPKYLYAIVAILFLLFGGSFAFSMVRHQTPWNAVLQAAIPTPQALFGKDSLRVLVVGLDYDYDEKDQETSAHSRSDVIMAVNLDFNHHRVYELSIPRDMVATLPNGQQAKINQAQSDGGISESQAVVAKWLGIPGFDRYVVLRIDTMKDLINAIGGIDVYVKSSDCLKYKTNCTGDSIDYDDTWGHLHVHLAEGLHHLNGDQAVGYARFRHDWCSDPCRIMRQQEVVRSILAKIKGNGGMGVIGQIQPLIGVVNKDVQTNLTAQEEVSLAFAFRELSPSRVVTDQVPYVRDVDLPGYGDSIVADEGAKARLVRKMLLDPPVTPEPVARR